MIGESPATPSKNNTASNPTTPSSTSKRKRPTTSDVIDLEKEESEEAKRSRMMQVGNSKVQGNKTNDSDMSSKPKILKQLSSPKRDKSGPGVRLFHCHYG